MKNCQITKHQNYTSDRSSFQRTRKIEMREEASLTFIQRSYVIHFSLDSLFFIPRIRATHPAIVNLLGRQRSDVNVRIAWRKGRVDITQILISTVEINARFWSLINARDSVQLGPVHPHRWIRTSSQDIAPPPSFLPSFSSFPPRLVGQKCVRVCLYVLTYLALPVLISHEANVRSTRPKPTLVGLGGKKMARMKAKCLRGYRENSSRPVSQPGTTV